MSLCASQLEAVRDAPTQAAVFALTSGAGPLRSRTLLETVLVSMLHTAHPQTLCYLDMGHSCSTLLWYKAQRKCSCSSRPLLFTNKAP